jgi:hypothetical protein
VPSSFRNARTIGDAQGSGHRIGDAACTRKERRDADCDGLGQLAGLRALSSQGATSCVTWWRCRRWFGCTHAEATILRPEVCGVGIVSHIDGKLTSLDLGGNSLVATFGSGASGWRTDIEAGLPCLAYNH